MKLGSRDHIENGVPGGTQRARLRKQFGTKDTPECPNPPITDERLREATRIAREALRIELRRGRSFTNNLEEECINKGIKFAFRLPNEGPEWLKNFMPQEVAYLWKELRKRRRGAKNASFDFAKLRVADRLYIGPEPDAVKSQVGWTREAKRWPFRTPKEVFDEALQRASEKYHDLTAMEGRPKQEAARRAATLTMPEIAARIRKDEWNPFYRALMRELGRRGGVKIAFHRRKPDERIPPPTQPAEIADKLPQQGDLFF